MKPVIANKLGLSYHRFGWKWLGFVRVSYNHKPEVSWLFQFFGSTYVLWEG